LDRIEAIWKYNPGANPPTSSAYTDLTSNSDLNTSFTFISAATDAIYFGFSRRFIGFMADLATNGNYSGMTFQYLATNSLWKNLQLIDSYSFSTSKYLRWNLPNDWDRVDFTTVFPGVVAPPDNVERYWVKIAVSSVVTPAVISKIRVIPFVQYTNPYKIFQFMALKKPFDSSSKPTDLSVEDMIRRAEDRIDYRTKKSWRFNAVTEQTDPVYVDFSRTGMFLRNRNFYRIYSVEIWNGSAWNTLTEGRNADYQVDYNLGMIYLTRLYIMPATFGLSGRFTQYNIGEYKNAIQVDYVYGRNSETDREFYVVEDLATKMVAVDLLRHMDYTVNVVSGADNVPPADKIRNLEDEIEMHIDELTGVSIV
jgi:hypothetical protein